MSVLYEEYYTKQFLGCVGNKRGSAFNLMADAVRIYLTSSHLVQETKEISIRTSGITYDGTDLFIVMGDCFCRMIDLLFAHGSVLFQPWSQEAAGIYEIMKECQFNWQWVSKDNLQSEAGTGEATLLNRRLVFWADAIRPDKTCEITIGPLITASNNKRICFFERLSGELLATMTSPDALAFFVIADAIRRIGIDTPFSNISPDACQLSTGIIYDGKNFLIDKELFCNLVEQSLKDEISIFFPWIVSAAAIYEVLHHQRYTWFWSRPQHPWLWDDDTLPGLINLIPEYSENVVRPKEDSGITFAPPTYDYSYPS